jgi:hypothetical protein
VIVGGGSLPERVRERFLELAGGKKARLVIIPTAHTKADRMESLASYSFWRAQKVASVTFLHTRKPSEANDPKFVKALTVATGVWFPGGDQSLLVAPYRGSLVERLSGCYRPPPGGPGLLRAVPAVRLARDGPRAGAAGLCAPQGTHGGHPRGPPDPPPAQVGTGQPICVVKDGGGRNRMRERAKRWRAA